MHRAVWITSIVAVVLAAVVLAVTWAFLRPGGPALVAAGLSHTTLSPNADGADDVTHITYQLRRPAEISIYFLDSQGRRYTFRTDRPREARRPRSGF